MPNQVLLIASRQPARKPETRVDGPWLCIANYGIPVFWFSLFDAGSLVTASFRESGGDQQYPYLVTETEAALRRARERWPRLRHALGPEYERHFEAWWNFLKANRAPYFHCETEEIYAMETDPPLFEAGLRRSIAAFDEEPWQRAGLLWKRNSLAPVWRQLLGEAAGGVQAGRKIPAYVLCGYGGEEPGPWEDE